jgi:hypothetical protein
MRGVSTGQYRYYADKLCRCKLPKEHRGHQPNVSAPEIKEQVRDLVTRIRIPAEWQERILAYVFSDGGIDEFLFEKKIIRERLRRAEDLYRRGNYTREEFARIESQCHRQLRALAPTAWTRSTASTATSGGCTTAPSPWAIATATARAAPI